MTTNNEAFDINQPFVTQEQKFKYWEESKAEIKKLQASNHDLREALKLTLGVITGETLSKSFLTKALEKSKAALSAKPAESLQAHDLVGRIRKSLKGKL